MNRCTRYAVWRFSHSGVSQGLPQRRGRAAAQRGGSEGRWPQVETPKAYYRDGYPATIGKPAGSNYILLLGRAERRDTD